MYDVDEAKKQKRSKGNLQSGHIKHLLCLIIKKTINLTCFVFIGFLIVPAFRMFPRPSTT